VERAWTRRASLCICQACNRANPDRDPAAWLGVGAKAGAAADAVGTDVLVSAGCAFYATLSLFPGNQHAGLRVRGWYSISATVEPQLQQLRDLLPTPACSRCLMRACGSGAPTAGHARHQSRYQHRDRPLEATTGTKAMLSALNVAYDESEQRSMLAFQLTALGMTLCAILAAIIFHLPRWSWCPRWSPSSV